MIHTYAETGTILDRILRRTTADVAERKLMTSYGMLEFAIARRSAPVSLSAALAGPGISVIAEFKRASPSKGRFSVEIDPASIAHEYLTGGAAALSILTDAPFFEGSMDDLVAAATVAHDWTPPAPVLRKDFIVDDYQILEAAAIDADAVLLIVAALPQLSLVKLLEFARLQGVEAVVEIHDDEERQRAVDAGAQIIGINNRNLKTFVVDLAVTEELAPRIPTGITIVGESGIFQHADVERMAAAGAHAILVGESLILAADRARAIQQLVGSVAPEDFST